MKRKILALLLSMAMIISGISGYVGEINSIYADEMVQNESVGFDLNGTENRPALRSDVFEDWVIPNTTSTQYTYDGVTYKLSCMGSGTLVGGQNKTLANAEGFSPLLTMDGAIIKDGGTDTYIRLEIDGLPKGVHTITTWHSIFNANAGTEDNIMWIELNGKTVESNLVLPYRITEDKDAAIGYFSFEAGENETVTIDFKSNGKGTYQYPVINAFEIDGAHPLRSVTNTYPENGDQHYELDDEMTWTAAEGAVSHDIYLGSSKEAVADATKKSSEYRGNTKVCKFDTSDMDLSHMETYYWRVDEVFADGSTEKGMVQSFGVAHLAFPSAEGYGRFARGGRGGEIIEVTNLNDSGKGSLRWALEEVTGPRVVVFKVGGIIKLSNKIIIDSEHDNVYVAGQTAPGDGITLINYSLGMMGAEDVIIRNVRVRVGDSNGVSCDGMGMAASNHCIIDHCSIAWSTDEGISSRGAKNITFQKNLIAEALHDSVHYNGDNREETETHSFAGSISGKIGTAHHNLITNCAGRNFSLAGAYDDDGVTLGGYLEISNNVFYNFKDRTTDGGVRRLNFISNYYKMGPESPDMKLLSMDSAYTASGDIQKAYVAGNMLVDREGKAVLAAKDDAWTKGYAVAGGNEESRSDEPLFDSFVTHESAEDAYESVLDDVGAIVPKHDYLDTRYLNEVKNTTYTYTGSKQSLKGIIDSQEDVGGYPTEEDFKGGEAPADTDHDGMPDAWETEHGLNPDNYEDAKIISLSAEGYTNIEMYLNELMGDKLVWAGEEVKSEPPVTSTPKPTRRPIVKETPEPQTSKIPDSSEIVTESEVPAAALNHVAVDMNGNENRSNLKSPTFTDWSITSSVTSSTKTIDGVTILLTSESGTTSFMGSQNKTLANEANTHYLCCDGIVLNENIKMTITGLSEGTHTLATWHNLFKNEYATASCLIDIYINDIKVESVAPTMVLGDDNSVGISYNSFYAKEGEEVVVYFRKAETSLSDYVVLNGFEIDGEVAENKVSNINPPANETNHDAAQGLSWEGASNAVSHDVYLGTDYDAVLDANRTSVEYKGNQTSCNYALSANLNSQNTYYWRVDEVDASGNITKGMVYMFEIRHLAFPSAIGDGQYSKIGRGGRTIEVTTLEDTGARGSLRWAVECEKGARVIVFKVSGEFVLDSELTVPKDGSNVYIAGQTAPDGEVNITGHPFVIDYANNVVIRNVKFTAESNQAGLEVRGGKFNIIDCCSFNSKTALKVDEESIISIQNNCYDGSYIGILDKAVTDEDKDGLPDDWEMEHGLNPEDKMDARVCTLSLEGYTNLEMYLNELMEDDLQWAEYEPTATEPPLETQKPVMSDLPTASEETSGSEEPIITGTPQSSKEPVVTGTQQPSKAPVVTGTQQPSKAPVVTGTQQPSKAPVVTGTQQSSKEPVIEASKQPSKTTVPTESDPAMGTTEPVETPVPGSSENGCLQGDVDMDKDVDLADAQQTLKAALKIIKLSEKQIEIADVDGNGEVTLSDAQLILKYALKIIITFDKIYRLSES